MKFAAREDIEAPVGFVFETLTDFEHFERAALRRGAEVVRKDGTNGPEWQIAFDWRGKRREAVLRMDEASRPGLLRFGFASRVIDGESRVELIALGPRRTRMSVSTEVRPRTLPARLFLQSLKLARARVLGRYRKRVGEIAALVCERYAAGGAAR